MEGEGDGWGMVKGRQIKGGRWRAGERKVWRQGCRGGTGAGGGRGEVGQGQVRAEAAGGQVKGFGVDDHYWLVLNKEAGYYSTSVDSHVSNAVAIKHGGLKILVNY